MCFYCVMLDGVGLFSHLHLMKYFLMCENVASLLTQRVTIAIFGFTSNSDSDVSSPKRMQLEYWDFFSD